jgi:hypothetical protein
MITGTPSLLAAWQKFDMLIMGSCTLRIHKSTRSVHFQVSKVFELLTIDT